MLASIDLAAGSVVSRALFWVRFRLGALLGWDDPAKRRPIPGNAETSLRARLERADLRARLARADAAPRVIGRFEPLYMTADEYAAEISNDTVHGVLHLGWVDQGAGRYRARLAVYVKARGALGRAYLALIRPFRHLVVYPALTRRIGRAWDERARS